MKTLWKCVFMVLFVTALGLFGIIFSMYWWPSIPDSPRPSEGRIYPLNNHGHYTYMNESEHRLQETFSWSYPALILALGAIDNLVDPFDYKRRQRFYRS